MAEGMAAINFFLSAFKTRVYVLQHAQEAGGTLSLRTRPVGRTVSGTLDERPRARTLLVLLLPRFLLSILSIGARMLH